MFRVAAAVADSLAGEVLFDLGLAAKAASFTFSAQNGLLPLKFLFNGRWVFSFLSPLGELFQFSLVQAPCGDVPDVRGRHRSGQQLNFNVFVNDFLQKDLKPTAKAKVKQISENAKCEDADGKDTQFFNIRFNNYL